MTQPAPPPVPLWIPGPPPPSPWAVVAAVVVGLWAVAVAVGASVLSWLVDQVFLVSGVPVPGWSWAVAALVGGLLVGAPAGVLAVVPRSAGVRAAGRAWLAGAAAFGVLGLLRAVPIAHHEVYLAALALGAAVGAAVLRRGRVGGRVGTGSRALAVAAGLAVALPWLWAGALGGLLETVLAVAAAAAVGWLAAAVLDGRFWSAYDTGPVRLVLLGGLVAGVALALLAGGVGQRGTQLAQLLVLPALGFAAAALWAFASRDAGPPRRYAAYTAPGEDPPTAAPVGWLVGVAAAGPLALADPEEITLLLATGRDVPAWVGIAAAGSLAVAVLLAVGYGVASARLVPHRWVGVAVVGVLLVSGTAVHLGAGQPGLHGERLFVVMKEQADLSDVAAGGTGPAGRDARVAEVYRRLVDTAGRTQADLRADLRRWRLSYTPYYLVNGLEVDGGPAVRAWLSRRPDVDRVLLSQRLRPLPATPGGTRGSSGLPAGPLWNLALIGADRAGAVADGSGVVVGSSDSGVDGAHPALAPGFRGGEDSWYDPWNATRAPADRGGHGTHTLGSAVGRQGIGVAPGAQWVGCVNLDRNLGNPARYLDCLQFMLAPFPAGGDPFTAGRPARAPHVLTNSWGCPALEGCDLDALRSATAAFAAAGVFFVAAAGNTGPFCDSIDDPPAPYADVLTVGAVDRERQVTDFSSRGPAAGGTAKPDVVAPGAGILSALPGGTYGELDGTSMAAPHVAGVVALMWSANPGLVGDLDRTRAILRDTATPVSLAPSTDDCGAPAALTGAGLVDAFAAVEAARRVG